MTIQQMKEFVSLASTCSFQDTAEQLYISQSSLSKHIQQLEKELGVSLFDRSTRTVKLNPLGEAYCKYALQIIKLHTDSIQELSRLSSVNDSRLTIGYTSTLVRYGIIDVIADFNKQYPDVTVNFVDIRAPEINSQLNNCNFVFAPEHMITGTCFKRILFKRDCLAIVFPESHPLAHEDFVQIEQLKDEYFFFHTLKYGHYGAEKNAFIELCQRSGFTPKYNEIDGFSTTILRMVANEMGCAVMYRQQVSETSGVSIVNIYPEVLQNICIFYLKKQQNTEYEKLFLEFIQNNFSA